MNTFLGDLFRELPWLKAALDWAIAILFVFVVLTPLCYYVFWPFFVRVRAQMAKVIASLKEALAEARRARKQSLDAEADEFLNDGGLWRLSANAAALWSGELRHICEVLDKMGAPVDKAAKSLATSASQIPDLIKSLMAIEVGAAQPLPALPSAVVATDSIAEHRVSWLKLVLTSLILAAIMTVNTVMLSQILRDLGVIPPALSFAGISLAYVVAFLMTAIEAGLGVGHSATRTRNSEKFSIWPAFFTFLAFLLSLVEGFFWSRIAPASGTLTLPFVNYEMPQQSLFFCFGFALVWTLFGLGSVGFEAFADVLRGRHDDLLSRALRNLRHLHERYSVSVQNAQKMREQMSKDTSALDQKIQGPAANAVSVRELLEKMRSEIEERAKSEPNWAHREERPLARSEVYHLSQLAGLWLFVSIACSIALAAMSLGSISHDTENSTRWALALVPTLTFFGIGISLGTRETIVRGGADTNERRVVGGPILLRGACWAIGSVLSAFYLYLVLTRSPFWLFDLVLGLFLAFAGYQLGPLLGVIKLFVRRLWNLVVASVSMAWFGFSRAFQFLVIVLEYVAYFFAAPLERVLAKKQVSPVEPLKARSAETGM